MIVLKKKGDSADLSKRMSNVDVKLSWTKSVDLDLHAFYKTKSGTFGHISFVRKGSLSEPPCILLDKDAGVGATAGDNRENIKIATLAHVDYVLIATNIFRFIGFLSSGDSFAKYDGKVVVKTDGGDHIEVPLTSEEIGKWCVIAKIDNTNPTAPKVVNINKVQKLEPSLNEF
ncbi:stress response protein [Tolypothrix campylonemoides VB511288]|nr:stress response protein [Tolypothrix campylonemoides VB511288]